MKTKFYFALLLIFLLLNLGQGSWGLSESSEARYAEISREMVLSGDYLHPMLLGIRHYHKPPLTYYLTSLGYQIFGINEYGARFFLSVALILQLLLVFNIGRLLFDDIKIAIASALIYFSFPVILIASRNLTTDAYLVTSILASLFFWLRYKKSEKISNLYLFYTVLGLGFLIKGPVVFIPLIIFIASWKIIYKEKIRVTLHTVMGLLLLVLISASWFLVLIYNDPSLLNYFWQEQIVNRSISAEKFHRAKPFWFYLVFAPLIGLPWIIFITIDSIKKLKVITAERSIVSVLFFTCTVLIVVFSFFSSKLILYILPIYPFLALLGGYLIMQSSEQMLKIYIGIYIGFYILIVGILISLGFLQDIKINLAIAILLVMLIVSYALYFLEYGQFKKRVTLGGLSIGFTISILFVYTSVSSANPYLINSVEEVIHFIQKEKKGDFKLVVYDELLPSASFYLKKPIITISNTDFNTQRDLRFQKEGLYHNTYIDIKKSSDLARFKKLLNSENVLLTKKKNPIPDSLNYLLKNFNHQKELGKWEVYY